MEAFIGTRSPLEGPVVQRKGCSFPVLPIELFLSLHFRADGSRKVLIESVFEFESLSLRLYMVDTG